jgi:Rieske 2Fe-2S family protein
MTAHTAPHPLSPRLDHCPPGLPRAAYLDPAWFDREMATVFARQWVMAGRLDDFAPGTIRRARVGTAEVVVARDTAGALSAFHNVCPHRGSELCRAAVEPLGKLIRCPYHAFAFAASDGHLVATGAARPTADFDWQAHGLTPVATRDWNGFLFLSLARDPGALWADVGLDTLANWPMAGLAVGHHWRTEIACNWKVFWENYSECLHCPGVHPGLSALVPVYAQGIMAANEAPGWTPEAAVPGPVLRPGAASWTPDGRACGPAFPGLTAAEMQAGHSFVTLWPSAYVVAHVDHVRAVRIRPLAPDRTALLADWLFPPATLAQPGFDPAAIAAFARTVIAEDGAAAEMTQRGLRSPAFSAARLMPEEYEIHRFHQWLLAEMEGHP